MSPFIYGYTKSLRDVFKIFFPFSFLLSLSPISHRIFHCTNIYFCVFHVITEFLRWAFINNKFISHKTRAWKCQGQGQRSHISTSATSSHRASLKSKSKMENLQNILFSETYWHENTGFPVIIISVHFLEPSWSNHLWDVYLCILLYRSYPCLKGQNYCVLTPQKHWYSLNLILSSFSEIFSHSWY